MTRGFLWDTVFGEGTKLGSPPSRSVKVCCGSTKARLLQGRKGVVVSAVGLPRVKGT